MEEQVGGRAGLSRDPVRAEAGPIRRQGTAVDPEPKWQLPVALTRLLHILGIERDRHGLATLGAGPSLAELVGTWDSRYTFFSSGRNTEFEGVHRLQLRVEHGRLTGRSEPTTGTVELDLTTDGLLVTGSWTERTATDGYYRGAVYHGILQLMLDPTGRSMSGRWLGPDKNFVINSGTWTLTRA